MNQPEKTLLLGVGNIYVETNYLGLETAGADSLSIGKEYRALTHETRLGGSVTNFIVQAHNLGMDVGLIGKIGDDDEGDKLIQLLHAAGVSSDFIIRDSAVQTSVDTGLVFAHNRQNIQLVAGNANQELHRNDINLNNPVFQTVQAVYFGGFLKQEKLYRDYPDLLGNLQKRGIRTFLDHGRIPVDVAPDKLQVLYDALKSVDGYLPNEDEIMGITGASNLNDAMDRALAMGPKFVVVKLGGKGCRVKSSQVDITNSGHSVNVISVVGAGDAFNAGFITQYLKGKDLSECLAFANATAAIRVSENRNPTFPEVEQFQRLHTG